MSEVVEIGDRPPTDTRPTQQSPCTNERATDTTRPNLRSSDDEDLLHVADSISVSVWLVILISTLERFAFFGIREPFRRFVVVFFYSY
jgi:hypothetical protein